MLGLLHRRKARRRRGLLNGSVEALAKPFKWSTGNSAMRSDRIKTERRELATIHGNGGSVLGGVSTAHYAQKLPQSWVKGFVIFVGAAMTAVFFWRGYR